nr:NADH-ubiquinone oxidoreductase chain 2 [Tanacetum cinerariifolium]
MFQPVTTADGQTVQKPIYEIKAFYDCGYQSTCEATLRIFGFEIRYRTKSVERRSFQPGEQQGVYDENLDLETVIRQSSVRHAGLLDDDKEYVESIKDVAHWAPAEQLRELFVTMLSQKKFTTPLTVWLQTWHLLEQDVQYKRRQIL